MALQYKTRQYNTRQYNTLQYNNSTIQYNNSTIQYNTIQYNTMQRNTTQHNTTQHNTTTTTTQHNTNTNTNTNTHNTNSTLLILYGNYSLYHAGAMHDFAMTRTRSHYDFSVAWELMLRGTPASVLYDGQRRSRKSSRRRPHLFLRVLENPTAVRSPTHCMPCVIHCKTAVPFFGFLWCLTPKSKHRG